MCTTFSEAAALTPALKLGIDFKIGTMRTAVGLDSKLLLHWAGQVTSIHLTDEDFAMAGLQTFLAAASSLRSVGLWSDGPRAAAEAEHVLTMTGNLTELILWGLDKPCILPTSITALTAHFACEGREITRWNNRQVDALIYRAARLPVLRHLSLEFGYLSHDEELDWHQISFACPFQLHSLESLSMNFELNDSTQADLTWLIRQPCVRLSVVVRLKTSSFAQHTKVVQQLRKLKLHNLLLVLMVDFPHALQRLWGQVHASEVEVHIADLQDFNMEPEPLQVLPQGMCIKVEAWGAGKLFITWQALTRTANDFELKLCSTAELHVTGAGSPPDQPWALRVLQAGATCGLPSGELRQPYRYFLQNGLVSS